MMLVRKEWILRLVVLFLTFSAVAAGPRYTVQVLGPNITSITTALTEHARLYENLTSVTVDFTWVTELDDLLQETLEALDANVLRYDGFLIPSSFLGETYTKLEDLSDRIKGEPIWEDYRTFVQSSATFNESQLGVPLSGEVLMLYYREDVFDTNGISAPKTIQDLVSVGKALKGKDFNGDSQDDFPFCFPKGRGDRMSKVFFSLLAPFIQTKGMAQGAFFDQNQKMKPFMNPNNPAFTLALSYWKYFTDLSPEIDEDDDDNNDEDSTFVGLRDYFLAGRCAMIIDWPRLGYDLFNFNYSRVPVNAPLYRWNVTRVPGTKTVYVPDQGLVSCKRSICPYTDNSANLINYAPFSAYGPWLGTVNMDSPSRVRDAVYNFWVFVATSPQADKDLTAGVFAPSRSTQFSNETLWSSFSGSFWPQYLKTLGVSLSFNSVIDLRVKSSFKYWDVVGDNLFEYVANRQSRKETMKEIHEGWQAITDAVGKKVQERIYAAGLSPPRGSSSSSGKSGDDKNNNKKSSSSDDGGPDLFLAILLPVSLVVVIVIVAFSAIFVIQRRRMKRQVYTAIQKAKKDTSWQIDISQLELKERIGLGSFGEVYRGFYRGTEVAVKRLRETKLTDRMLQEFIQETQILCELRHPHVVLFMGACTEPPNACIVTEYMPQGSLYDVLHNHAIQLDWKLMKNMAMDAARGMDYLHSSAPPVLHRDFKSLNLLVDQKWNLKVADFGLTVFKDMIRNDDRVGSVQWTAPEVLKNEDYTEKADVYSYGVVLWELVTRKDPYEGLNRNYITVAVIEGLRPTIPPHVPQQLKELIMDCWDAMPEKRPTFKEIRTRLSDLEFASISPPMLVTVDMMSDDGIPGSFSLNPSEAYLSCQNNPPSGLVSVVFTNITGYDVLWQNCPQEMQEAIMLHINILRRLMQEYQGYEASNENDSFMIVFSDHKRAAKFCLVAQEEFLLANWPKRLLDHELAAEMRDANGALVSRGLKVRMGIHSGEPHFTTDAITGHRDYFGSVVNTAAKVTSFAESGEVLLTKETYHLIADHLNFLDRPIIEEVSRLKLVNDSSRQLYRITPQALKGRKFYSGEKEQLGTLGSVGSSGGDLAWGAQLDKISSKLHQRWIIPYEELSIEQKIGEGSFGEVFKGKWRGSELAIKRLFRQQADDRILLELRKESVIMSSLRHPNILLFLGVCIVPPNLCILTEYMKNGSLGPFLRNKSNKLSWLECLNMGKQAAIGMDYLHSLRPPLIHRDLSSYNILVDKNLRVKIGDFGLSRIKAQNATMTRCGTVAWTAPEILEGKDYSEKSDVYSFGIILWELFSREKPFKGLDSATVLQSVIANYRPPISSECPPLYAKIIQHCWDADPKKRPSFEKVMARLEKMEQDARLKRSPASINNDIGSFDGHIDV